MSIIGTKQFFSLFELRRAASGAYFIADHAGDWLRLNSLEGADGFERLEAIKYRPPPPPDPASDAEHSAVVEVEQRSTGVAASSGPTPSPFWLTRHASGAYMVQVSADGRWYLCEHAADPQKLVAAAGGTVEGVNTSALFELQRVVAPEKEREQEAAPPGGALSFVERAKRCVMRKGGRDVVLATYHNIGMMDWASLFWGWLKASAIDRFFLLELDGLTCKAARALNVSVHFECATAADMMLPPELTHIQKASALADWGTTAESAYFKFLRWKLRFVELLAMQGVDVLMADVDVLILSPQFVPELVDMNVDLVISSDARQGSYDDNVHCPCSNAMYQRYTFDWVCAGLFYMRATPAALWFMRQAQEMMDEYTITDQDAIQAVLTGHTQVAIPQDKKRGNVSDGVSGAAARRAGSWLKPIWLEGLGATENLRNMRGTQPLNAPMKEPMWLRLLSAQKAKGFTWKTMPLERYGNGPILVHHWESMFGRSYGEGKAQLGDAPGIGGFRSIHANCNTKSWLAQDVRSRSFLLQPKPLK